MVVRIIKLHNRRSLPLCVTELPPSKQKCGNDSISFKNKQQLCDAGDRSRQIKFITRHRGSVPGTASKVYFEEITYRSREVAVT